MNVISYTIYVYVILILYYFEIKLQSIFMINEIIVIQYILYNLNAFRLRFWLILLIIRPGLDILSTEGKIIFFATILIFYIMQNKTQNFNSRREYR